jgi:predicted anti-sigma-YlaC factor YlaD
MHVITVSERMPAAWMLLGLVLALSLGTGCSVKKIAVNKFGDALSRGGTTFASDDDPELVREALPFALKLMESLLAESPNHRGLLYATASGFTQYAYAFVQQEADEKAEENLAATEALRLRARRLYLRGRNYGLRGLEVAHRDFGAALRRNPKEAVGMAQKKDVPLLYWTAAAWGSAIGVAKDNPELVADLSIVEALINRALELDETYDQGAIHAFLISFELARPGGAGDPATRAKTHFDRAMELSRGKRAGPLVSYAEGVLIQQQKRVEFEALLQRALAIDADTAPESRLANLVAQRRARWLLKRIDDLFVESEAK